MADGFQRLFARGDSAVMSLNVQAARGAVLPPDRSQFILLLRHFLERFFNHESASPDGDAKARLVQIACAAGLPGLMVAMYLWPVYHPFRWVPGNDASPPSYWLQVNHHFFFVLYSFVVMGIVTVFEWDLFFPDLLDIFVLGTLPVADGRIFFARVAAIGVFLLGFLFDANILAPIVLPMSVDPADLARFLCGHLLAVAGSGLFASVLVLAIQGVLLALLGDRLVRRVSLFVQGLSVSVLLMLLLLFPVLSGVVPVLLQSGSLPVRWFPPFWFLGVYQRILEGPAALPIYSKLATTGLMALAAIAFLAVLTYPLAYLRKARELIEGSSARSARYFGMHPVRAVLHATVIRLPVRRAVCHFISQTLLRVPRYRIYLVLYGGAGLSVILSGMLRCTVDHGHVVLDVSADGVRASLCIAAFWVIAGLRMAFVSPGNQRGSWIFRIVHGAPPIFKAARDEFAAAKVWTLICAVCVTLCLWASLRAIAPVNLRTGASTAVQLLVAVSMCLLLTDIFFLNVTTIAFTGKPPREKPNLAATVLKYFAFFPLIAWVPVASEPWMQAKVSHLLGAISLITAAHVLLERRHQRIIAEYSNSLELEDDEEDFPMKLGLRY